MISSSGIKISPFINLMQFLFLLSCSGLEFGNFCDNQIVFLSDREKSNREFDVYLYDLNTQKTTNLTSQLSNVVIRSPSSPKLNHKRNSVLFISCNPRNLVELNLDTHDIKTIASINYEATDYFISPDGRSIIFTEKVDSTLQLYKISLDDGEKVNLSNNQFNNFDASYSGNGEKVVYVCDQDGSNSIAIMNSDGSGQKILTNNFGDDRSPNFSPDNKKIVFSSSRGGIYDSDYDLYMIDTTGDNFSLFHDSNAFDTKPVFSPNNKFVAFVSNARGGLFRDIYLKEINTGTVQSITSELKYFSQNLMFSKDNKFIVFENTGPSDSDILIYVINDRKLKNITQQKGRDLSPAL